MKPVYVAILSLLNYAKCIRIGNAYKGRGQRHSL